MAITWQDLRRRIAQQTGLLWYVGSYDGNDSNQRALRSTDAARYGDNHINGFHVLLVDGEASTRELLVRRFLAANGDIEFIPTLTAPPTGTEYEILPFSATEFLEAARVAIDMSYDSGVLVRQFYTSIIGNSPIYNADFTEWGEDVPDGWVRTGSGSITREQSNADTLLSENSVRLNGVASLYLDETWQRFMPVYREGVDLRFKCWVKSDNSTVGIRLNLGGRQIEVRYNNNVNPNTWKLLELSADITEADTKIEPVLFSVGGNVVFNLPFVETNAERAYRFPVPISTMPDGPLQITSGFILAESDDSRQSWYVGRQIIIPTPRFLTYQHPGRRDKFGILDFSLSRRSPGENEILSLQTDGPLSKPNSILDTTLIEVNESEALLLSSLAAKHLLQRAATGMAPSTALPYERRLLELEMQIDQLSDGAGATRDTATYGLRW